MSNKFFITGLPRSRTAWMANLLSYGDKSFCFHEGIRRAKDNEGLFALYDSLPHEMVGDSSSGLLLNWKEVVARYPDAKWVFVQRNPQQVLDSCKKAFPWLRVTAPIIRDINAKLDAAMKAICGWDVSWLSVPYESLDKELPHILDFLGIEMHPRRIELCLENKTEIFAEKAASSPTTDAALRYSMVGLMKDHKPEPGGIEELSEKYRLLIAEMCGQRSDAAWFLNGLLSVWLVWDHFIDGDHQRRSDVDAAFTAMLINWPNNEFVCQWGRFLTPTISAAISANLYNGKSQKAWDVYTEIPMAVATILGGRALAEKYSKPIRDLVALMKAADDREDEV